MAFSTVSMNANLCCAGTEHFAIRSPRRDAPRFRQEKDSERIFTLQVSWVRSRGQAEDTPRHLRVDCRVHVSQNLRSLCSRNLSAFDNYFLQAQRVRSLVRRDFDRVFRTPNVLSTQAEINQTGVDVLIHPSAIRTAPRLDGDSAGSKSSLDSYLQDVLTVPASLAGLPALSVPMGLAGDGWPVGVSLVGQWGHEKTILNLGKVLGIS